MQVIREYTREVSFEPDGPPDAQGNPVTLYVRRPAHPAPVPGPAAGAAAEPRAFALAAGAARTVGPPSARAHVLSSAPRGQVRAVGTAMLLRALGAALRPRAAALPQLLRGADRADRRARSGRARADRPDARAAARRGRDDRRSRSRPARGARDRRRRLRRGRIRGQLRAELARIDALARPLPAAAQRRADVLVPHRGRQGDHPARQPRGAAARRGRLPVRRVSHRGAAPPAERRRSRLRSAVHARTARAHRRIRAHVRARPACASARRSTASCSTRAISTNRSTCPTRSCTTCCASTPTCCSPSCPRPKA